MGQSTCSARETCDSYRSLDVRQLHREGRVRAGQSFWISWSYRGEPLGSVAIKTEPDLMVLTFQRRSSASEEWSAVEQHVPVVWTSCPFGGQRPWFCCSAYSSGRCCGRRVAKLYFGNGVFACRQCHGLAYASQHEAPGDRARSKAQKIRERLAGSANLMEPFPEKPKGMHWSTYERLRARSQAAEARSIDVLREWIQRPHS
jgi:hypothetical protein